MQSSHRTRNAILRTYKIGSFEAPPIPESVNRTSTLYDFLQRCFTLNYKDRANAQELFEHPFLRVADAEEQTQVSIDSFPEGSSRDGSGALNE